MKARKVLALVLAFAMCLGMIPGFASADDLVADGTIVAGWLDKVAITGAMGTAGAAVGSPTQLKGYVTAPTTLVLLVKGNTAALEYGVGASALSGTFTKTGDLTQGALTGYYDGKASVAVDGVDYYVYYKTNFALGAGNSHIHIKSGEAAYYDVDLSTSGRMSTTKGNNVVEVKGADVFGQDFTYYYENLVGGKGFSYSELPVVEDKVTVTLSGDVSYAAGESAGNSDPKTFTPTQNTDLNLGGHEIVAKDVFSKDYGCGVYMSENVALNISDGTIRAPWPALNIKAGTVDVSNVTITNVQSNGQTYTDIGIPAKDVYGGVVQVSQKGDTPVSLTMDKDCKIIADTSTALLVSKSDGSSTASATLTGTTITHTHASGNVIGKGKYLSAICVGTDRSYSAGSVTWGEALKDVSVTLDGVSVTSDLVALEVNSNEVTVKGGSLTSSAGSAVSLMGGKLTIEDSETAAQAGTAIQANGYFEKTVAYVSGFPYNDGSAIYVGSNYNQTISEDEGTKNTIPYAELDISGTPTISSKNGYALRVGGDVAGGANNGAKITIAGVSSGGKVTGGPTFSSTTSGGFYTANNVKDETVAKNAIYIDKAALWTESGSLDITGGYYDTDPSKLYTYNSGTAKVDETASGYLTEGYGAYDYKNTPTGDAGKDGFYLVTTGRNTAELASVTINGVKVEVTESATSANATAATAKNIGGEKGISVVQNRDDAETAGVNESKTISILVKANDRATVKAGAAWGTTLAEAAGYVNFGEATPLDQSDGAKATAISVDETKSASEGATLYAIFEVTSETGRTTYYYETLVTYKLSTANLKTVFGLTKTGTVANSGEKVTVGGTEYKYVFVNGQTDVIFASPDIADGTETTYKFGVASDTPVTVKATDFVLKDTGAEMAFYGTDSRRVTEAESVQLEVGKTTELYLTVTSADESVTVPYTIEVTVCSTNVNLTALTVDNVKVDLTGKTASKNKNLPTELKLTLTQADIDAIDTPAETDGTTLYITGEAFKTTNLAPAAANANLAYIYPYAEKPSTEAEWTTLWDAVDDHDYTIATPTGVFTTEATPLANYIIKSDAGNWVLKQDDGGIGYTVYIEVLAADGLTKGYYSLDVTVKAASETTELKSLKLNGVTVPMTSTKTDDFTIGSTTTTCTVLTVPATTKIPIVAGNVMNVEMDTNFAGTVAAAAPTSGVTVTFDNITAADDAALYTDSETSRVWSFDTTYTYPDPSVPLYVKVTNEKGENPVYYRVDFTAETAADASNSTSIKSLTLTPATDATTLATAKPVITAQTDWTGDGEIAKPYRKSVSVSYSDLIGESGSALANLMLELETDDATKVEYALAPYSTSSVSNYTLPLVKDGDSFSNIGTAPALAGAFDDYFTAAKYTTVSDVTYGQSIFLKVTAQDGKSVNWYRVDVTVTTADTNDALKTLSYQLSYTDGDGAAQTMTTVNVPLVTDDLADNYGQIDKTAVAALDGNYNVSTDGYTLYVTLDNGIYKGAKALVSAAAASNKAVVTIDGDLNKASSDTATVLLGNIAESYGSKPVVAVTSESGAAPQNYKIFFRMGAADTNVDASIDYTVGSVTGTTVSTKSAVNSKYIAVQLPNNPNLKAGAKVNVTITPDSKYGTAVPETLELTLLDNTSGSAFSTDVVANLGGAGKYNVSGAATDTVKLAAEKTFTVKAQKEGTSKVYNLAFYMLSTANSETGLNSWTYKAGSDAAVTFSSSGKMTTAGTKSTSGLTTGKITDTVKLYNDGTEPAGVKALLANANGEMTIKVTPKDAYSYVSSASYVKGSGAKTAITTLPTKQEGAYTFTLPLEYGNGSLEYVLTAEDGVTATTYVAEFQSSIYVDTQGPSGDAIRGANLTKALAVARAQSSKIVTIIPMDNGADDGIAQVKLAKTLNSAGGNGLSDGFVAVNVVTDFGSVLIPQQAFAALADPTSVTGSVTVKVQNLTAAETEVASATQFDTYDFNHAFIVSATHDNNVAYTTGTTSETTTINGVLNSYPIVVTYADTSYKAADNAKYVVFYKDTSVTPVVLQDAADAYAQKNGSVADGNASVDAERLDLSAYLLKKAGTNLVTFGIGTNPATFADSFYVSVKDQSGFEFKSGAAANHEKEIKSSSLSFTVEELRPENYTVQSVQYFLTTGGSAANAVDVPVENGVYTVPVTAPTTVYVTLAGSATVTDATEDTNGKLLINGVDASESIFAAVNSTVTIAMDPKVTGYEIKDLTVAWGNTTLDKSDLEYDETTGEYSFTMPSSKAAVTVTATFEKLSVTVADGSASKGTANELKGTVSGTTLTVSGTAPVVAVDQDGKALAKGTAANTFTLTGNETAVTLVRLGDVDLNGKVEANDALYAAENAVGSRTLTGAALAAANVDGTAGVSGNDALYIAEAAVGNRTLAW